MTLAGELSPLIHAVPPASGSGTRKNWPHAYFSWEDLSPCLGSPQPLSLCLGVGKK